MRNVLKLIAVLTMVIDHVGAVLYPDVVILRIIGRLSFPIFAYLIALGYESTHNLRKYLLRLFIFGIISQTPFMLAFHTSELNIFFTLFAGLLAITLYEKHGFVYLLLSLLAPLFIHADYGIYGVLTVFFMHISRKNYKLGYALFLLITLIYTYFRFLQIFAVFSLVVIHFLMRVKTDINIKKFKYIFYWFYPIHLFVLYCISLK